MKCKYSLGAFFLCFLALSLSCWVNPSAGTDGIRDSHDQALQKEGQDIIPSVDQEIRQTLESLRETYLIQDLNLPEEKAKNVLEKMQAVRQIRQNYVAHRGRIEQQLEAVLRSSEPDQTQIHTILRELETTKTRYYQSVLKIDQELRTLLSPEEQAKYVLFQRTFNKKLQDIIVRIRQQRSFSQDHPSPGILLRREEEESVIRHP